MNIIGKSLEKSEVVPVKSGKDSKASGKETSFSGDFERNSGKQTVKSGK